jgi:hypothetical protein
LVHLKFSSDTIRLAVLRNGERLFLDVPVAPPSRLIPTTTYDEPVPYFIYGGLVFVPFTEPYLHEWGEEWQADAPHELVNLLLSGARLENKTSPFCLLQAAVVRRGTPTQSSLFALDEQPSSSLPHLIPASVPSSPNPTLASCLP